MQNQDYQALRAWNALMGSSEHYIQGMVMMAREERAPEDAIYKNEKDEWARLGDVRNDNTRMYFEANHPELFEKFMAKEAA